MGEWNVLSRLSSILCICCCGPHSISWQCAPRQQMPLPQALSLLAWRGRSVHGCHLELTGCQFLKFASAFLALKSTVRCYGILARHRATVSTIQDHFRLFRLAQSCTWGAYAACWCQVATEGGDFGQRRRSWRRPIHYGPSWKWTWTSSQTAWKIRVSLFVLMFDASLFACKLVWVCFFNAFHFCTVRSCRTPTHQALRMQKHANGFTGTRQLPQF